MCAERGPVCLGDRASPPQVRPFTDRAWTVTRIPAVVESKSRFDRAEPAQSCSRDTAAAPDGLSPAISAMARGFDRSRAFFSWKQPDNDRKQCGDPSCYCRSRVPSALLVDHQ